MPLALLALHLLAGAHDHTVEFVEAISRHRAHVEKPHRRPLAPGDVCHEPCDQLGVIHAIERQQDSLRQTRGWLPSVGMRRLPGGDSFLPG